MLLCKVVAGQQGILKNFATRAEKYAAILQMVTYRISLPPPLYDQAKQDERFGPFSSREAVIPFVKDRVDLRFADAFNGRKITPEAKALKQATSNIIMLGTSASGKTRTIFDVARKDFMIYVACSLYSGPQEKTPSDVETTRDKVFPRLCSSIRAKVHSMWPDDRKGARAEADRLILADICSRLLFVARVFQEYPQITPEEFLLLQLNGGQDIILSYWKAVSEEATTDIKAVLDEAFNILFPMKRMRFAIDEAQIAAPLFSAKSDFHFLHEERIDEARGLLYKYCLFVDEYVSPAQLIVAGTDMTADTAAQLPTDLGKDFGSPIVFPVLKKKDVQVRLRRVLNMTDLDWNKVKNLGQLVGRCRWCATLVHELASRAEKSCDPHKKTQILDECIETCIEAVVKTMVSRLTQYLWKDQEKILERMFAVFTLFTKPLKGLNFLFDARSVDLMLKYGLGQLLKKTEEGHSVALDDYVTRTVVLRIGEIFKWSAADEIAKEIMNRYTTQTRASLGISFQMVVAAALCEFKGTISQLVQAVIACEPLNENMDVLPDWATQASLSATRYIEYDSDIEARQCLYSNNKLGLDTLIQPDDRMRPDLVGILTGGPHDDASFALAVSAKLRMKPLSGNDRTDDLASTCLHQAYLPKPSARAGKVYEPDSKWLTVHDPIKNYTRGRCLRLHVVLGGYSPYEKAPEDGEGVSGNRLKTVHVDGETIRVIIHEGNCHALFQTEFQQSLISTLMQKQRPSGHAEKSEEQRL
jgi:hypothetical protein